jgi:hypothetical protein
LKLVTQIEPEASTTSNGEETRATRFRAVRRSMRTTAFALSRVTHTALSVTASWQAYRPTRTR